MKPTLLGLCLSLLAAPALAQSAPGEPDAPGEPGSVRVPPAPAIQPPGPPIQPPGPRVPDASLRAMKERWAELTLQNGTRVVGRIIAVEDQTVTLIVPPNADVVSFDKASVVGLRSVALATDPNGPNGPNGPQAPAAPVAPPEPPGKPRHYGLMMGLAPSVTFDVDYKLFYGFVNASIVFPLATAGEALTGTVGAGINFPVAAGSSWHFEVFGHYSPLRTQDYSNEWRHALGVGVGIHYTARNGFTFGFKLPVIGYSARSSRSPFASSTSPGDAVGYYYLASAAGMPLGMIGYRF